MVVQLDRITTSFRPRLLFLVRQRSVVAHRPLILPRARTGFRSLLVHRPIHSRSSSMTHTEPQDGTHDAVVQADVKPPSDESKKTEETKLPPLSAQDFRTYNSLAEKMEYFHDHFRQSWNLLWTAATTGKRPQRMSARQLIDQGITFSDQLHMHHSIEEQMVFPMLGRRMPEFRGDLQGQHKLIHKGLDGFVAYLRECRRGGDKELDLAVLKEKMEGWGGVLWEHLDDEVKALGAENMRKYWTLDEVRKMPM